METEVTRAERSELIMGGRRLALINSAAILVRMQEL